MNKKRDGAEEKKGFETEENGMKTIKTDGPCEKKKKIREEKKLVSRGGECDEEKKRWT